ncbi:MAG: Ku protein [Acidobacteriota bacterium]|nr:Ku protein [Acidobacteriota bacterium]
MKIFRAARPERVKFHQLYRGNASRVKQRLVAEVEPEVEPRRDDPLPRFEQNAPRASANVPGPIRIAAATQIRETPASPSFPAPPIEESVPRNEIVKGYEFEKDRYVMIEDREIESLAPKTSSEMEILEFVKLAEIDPIYFETSYYVSPDKGGEKPYSLLFAAMRQTGNVAVAQVAMHNREHIALLRPGGKGIVMHTMYFANEVRKDREFAAETGAVGKKEMDLAVMLIETLAATFEPEKYKDKFRERLEAMIAAKVLGEEIVKAPEPEKREVIDIVAALKNSLALVRKPVHSASASSDAATADTAAPKPKKRRAGGS